MSRADLKAKPVSVYLPLDLYAKVQGKSEEELRTISQTITVIISDYFKSQTQPEP